MLLFKILDGIIFAIVMVMVAMVTIGYAIALLGGYTNEKFDKEE